jgi:hypothetical protein
VGKSFIFIPILARPTGKPTYMQGVANVEKPLLAVQLQFVKGFGLGIPADAVELLTMYANDAAQIAPPAQNGAEDMVEIWELHLIRDRDQADEHRSHLA